MHACPHCGESYDIRHIATHIDVCVFQPGKLARLRDELDDGTGRIVARNEYERRNSRSVSADWLRKRFGSWDKLADALGLASSRLRGLNAPLTDAERHCCQRRGMLESGMIR